MRAFVLDLQHPLKHEVLDEIAEQTINWTTAGQLRACLKHVKSELLAPSQREGNSKSYCPRCRCQFMVSAVECPDCPGVTLVAFSEVQVGGSES